MADDTSTSTSSSAKSAKPDFAVGDRVRLADGSEHVVMGVALDGFTLHELASDPTSPTYTEHGYVLLPAALLSHPQPASTLTRVP